MSNVASYARFLVMGVAAVMVLGACGGQQEQVAPKPTVSLPTESVTVPAGVTLTKPGTELGFGDTATVGFAPTPKRSTALALTVARVFRGRISDLARFDLNRAARASRPYYARVKVRNVGDGQIGRSAIPLWGLASDNTLIGASGFTTSFRTCPSGALPKSFGAGATTRTCLVFLVPAGASLVGVSYRPVMAEAPVVWKGTVTRPTAKRHVAHKKAAKKKRKASH
jgi:hypothetical protein